MIYFYIVLFRNCLKYKEKCLSKILFVNIFLESLIKINVKSFLKKEND